MNQLSKVYDDFLFVRSFIKFIKKFKSSKSSTELNLLRLKPIFESHHLLVLCISFSLIHLFTISILVETSWISLRVYHTLLVVLHIQTWKDSLVLNSLVIKYLTWNPSALFSFLLRSINKLVCLLLHYL